MFTELQNDIARRFRSWSSPAHHSPFPVVSGDARMGTIAGQPPKDQGGAARIDVRQAQPAMNSAPTLIDIEPPHLVPEVLNHYSLLVLDSDGCVRSWNDNMRQLLGYGEDEIVGAHVSAFCTEQDRRSGTADAELRTAVTSGFYCGTSPRQRKDGSTFEARVQITALRDNRQRLSGFIELMQAADTPPTSESTSTGEWPQAVERLLPENESIWRMLAVIGDGVITTDEMGNVTSLNPVAEQMTGWNVREAVGKSSATIFQLINENSRQPVSNPVARALHNERIIELEGNNMLLSRDGSRRAVENTCAPVFDQDQHVAGTVLVFRDVTTTRRHTRELQSQAQHDVLTGLVNRAEFERRLHRLLETAGDSHALCYLDLDRFNAVNDSCGHQAGDELLRQVSALIESKVRHRDTVARLGGDKFAILLEHCELQQAVRIAEAIHDEVGLLPYVWDHKAFNISVSIGVVALTGGEWTVVESIEAADSACYEAKQSEGPHVRVHTLQGERRSSGAAQISWEKRLRRALAHDLFQLHFQPIVAIAGKETSSLRGEILLRLADDSDDIVHPRAFLASAERSRLMLEIDQWVLSRLLIQLRPYAASLAAGKALISVNLSSQSIASKQFLKFVEQEFARSELPPECLCFEIAEEAATCNLRTSLHFMGTLHQQRHPLALDNFGGGLSSFDHLRALPIDFLKINGNLIRDVANDPVDTTLVEAMHRIGGLLGVKAIAVAAETDDILNRIKSVGVEYAQGFCIAKPELLESCLTGLTVA